MRVARLLLPVAAALAAAAVLSFRPIYEPDLWWHLAQGRENAAGRLVRANVFSFTHPGYRQQYTSWAFDTAAYLAWLAAGAAGVQALQAALLAAAALLLFAACRSRAPAWAATAVLLLGFFVLEPRAIPRPHLVSFAGMAALALIVHRAAAERSRRPLGYAMPVVAVWSNFHVEVVFGVLFLGAFAVGELVRPAALTRRQAMDAVLVSLVCAVLTMANPYGYGLLAYLYENVSVPQIMAIAELRPPYLPAYRALYLYAGVLVVALASQPRRLTVADVLIAAGFGVLGAMHLRLSPLVLFATAPLVAARLAALAARGVDPRAVLVTAACAAAVVSRVPLRMLATELAVGRAALEPPQFFSRGAVEFIRGARLGGPVFNSHNIGGYLAWTLHPDVRVFQDSRLQAYPPEHFRRILKASAAQADWNALVAGVDWAVLSVPRPNQLSGVGRFPDDEWERVYEDEAMEIRVRRRRLDRGRVLQEGGEGPRGGTERRTTPSARP
jgi:hypothetical protein